MNLIHKGCGGVVVEDFSKDPYEYDDDEGHVSFIYPYLCGRCGAEVLGDADLEDLEQSQVDLFTQGDKDG